MGKGPRRTGARIKHWVAFPFLFGHSIYFTFSSRFYYHTPVISLGIFCFIFCFSLENPLASCMSAMSLLPSFPCCFYLPLLASLASLTTNQSHWQIRAAAAKEGIWILVSQDLDLKPNSRTNHVSIAKQAKRHTHLNLCFLTWNDNQVMQGCHDDNLIQ